jgi:hypothetical protein
MCGTKNPNAKLAKSQKQLSELRTFRQSLFDKLSENHFDWKPVTLVEGVTLNICKTVKVDGYYLPVTAKETFAVAKRFGYYPLTRAVADRIQNKALFVPYRWQPELFDFEQYSAYLDSNGYDGICGFGAHKLWVLSHKRGVGGTSAVNYGFYELKSGQPAGTPNRGGDNLDSKYNPIQGLGGAHDDNHWDYSQLLQLMYASAPLNIDGENLSLSMALKAGKSAVSDKDKLTDQDLPF